MSVKTTRSNQIMSIWRIDNGMSVDKITGMTAEKNKIAEIEITATINFVTRTASVTIIAGKNISAIDNDSALAVSIGSGICSKYVNGAKIYASQSNSGV